jgi:hypothetical protein
MTLQARHDAWRVDKAPKLKEVAASPHAALAELLALWDLRSDSVPRPDVSGIDRFLERYLPLRDELAWRAARLERLTAVERAVLHAIDAILDRMDRRAEPLPDDAKQLVADVLRRR